jgi:hypothetical protein
VSFLGGVSGFVGVVGAFCCFWACSWALGLFVLLVYCLCTEAPFRFFNKIAYYLSKKGLSIVCVYVYMYTYAYTYIWLKYIYI